MDKQCLTFSEEITSSPVKGQTPPLARVAAIMDKLSEFKVNEQFKIWTAEKVVGKAKYIILQHGGGFGLNEFETEEDIQTEISDLFLTWGWDGKKKNVNPFIIYIYI